MSFAADLHLHSRYAYACSKNLSLENMATWAKLKGLDLLATGDFTHPMWRQELRQKLEMVSGGLFVFQGVRFVLGTEVSCVYSQGGRARRVHVLLLAPDFATVDRLCLALGEGGSKLEGDGRPTLRMSARDFTAMALEINPECIVIPAHVWTPWYGMFGSKSGFDSLEECFLDMAPRIRAVETGLSSDPAMNWAIPELEDRAIVSFSDAHSLPKMGREVTVFEGDLCYPGLAQALATNGVAYTVEFYPEEGKYHYSGHRKCGVRLSPEDIRRMGTRCPSCGRPLTLGVLHQIRQASCLSAGMSDALIDGDGFIRSARGRPPFMRLVPLLEIIAENLGRGTASKGVQQEYLHVVRELGGELRVLAHAGAADLEAAAGERMAQGILKARLGDVTVEPGYDGVYGTVRVWPDAPPTR